MKKIICLAIIALITGAGCKEAQQLANINVNLPYSQQITIPQIAGDTQGVPLPAGGAQLPFPAFAVATNSQQYIDSYKTSTNKIVSFTLMAMQVQILSPATQNFNFMDSIQLFISASGQPEVLVAYQYAIPMGQTTLMLNISPDVNLKNYFLQDTMYFRIYAHINAVPASGTQLNVASTFNLEANPLE